MPHLEKRTGNIVIRIVYDGAPEAGKTTNLTELVQAMPIQRRSNVVSPATTGRRTEFFDWVSFMGGYVDGRRLRCQLVSVPGQPSLLRRRRYLIDTADAVVFVADSRPQSVDESCRAFELMRAAVRRRGGEVPAGVLLQANKQDLEGALGPTELAQRLRLEEEVMVLPAAAVHGVGVMQTFIAAARLGTMRVKDLLTKTTWAELKDQESSAEELLAELQKLGEELDQSESRLVEASEPTRVPIAIPATEGTQTPVTSEPTRISISLEPEPAPPETDCEAENEWEPRELPPLPLDDHVMSGHVWPLVEGRTVFAELLGGRGFYAPTTSRWAPRGAIEAHVEDGAEVRWILHTRDEWSFQDAARAKLALITLVRRLRLLEPHAAPGRALSLHDDGKSLRIWMVSGVATTLRDVMRSAQPGVDDAIEAAVQVADALADTCVHPSCLDAIAFQDGRPFVLAIPDEAGRPLGEIRRELRDMEADRASVGPEGGTL